MISPPVKIWVIDREVCQATFERLGDARLLADRLSIRAGALVIGPERVESQALIERGADAVVHCRTPVAGPMTLTAAAANTLRESQPRLVLAPGDCVGREWAARLAARAGWKLISPALWVKVEREKLEVAGLDSTGRLFRTVPCPETEAAVITMRPGVAEALTADPARQGTAEMRDIQPEAETAALERKIHADPATVDIRFAHRLVAGGRGLGNKEGFELLRRFAQRLRASVAASRMAVDLGWIEYERQVGQTGKTVAPDLYVACGISGASHHLAGMSASRHIVAINTDDRAPIFSVAHLGLVADLREVLETAIESLEKNPAGES